ncbi:MAG: tRNA lysidine(34) synthetase TilS [Devosia sp.]
MNYQAPYPSQADAQDVDGTAAVPAATLVLPDGIDWSLIDNTPGRLGLAVSGGGDSVALAVLLREQRWYRDLTVLTVNHRLRMDAENDVRAVKALADQLNLPFMTRDARGHPTGSIQNWARQQRYGLFAEMAAEAGLSAIIVAHTMEDQAETLLLRLSRRSGVRGLAAMRPRAQRDGMVLLRPFLGVRREALRKSLKVRKVHWTEDPSNSDPSFERVAVRRLSGALKAAGLTAEALAASAAHLGRASDVVEEIVAQTWNNIVTVDRSAVVSIKAEPWRHLSDEVRLRILARAIHTAGGGTFEPRFRVVARMDKALRSGARSHGGRSLASVESGILRVWREHRAIRQLELFAGQSAVFDRRFIARSSASAPPVQISAIGNELAGLLPQTGYMPALPSTPAIFAAGAFVAAPTLGVYTPGWPREAVTLTRLR